MTDIRVPTLGESVTEATIGKWFKKPGDPVAVDEPLVELETDKVTIEVPAPAAGVLGEIAAKDGETVAVGALLGQIKEGAGARRQGHAGATGRPDQKTDTTAPINAADEEPRPRPETAPSRQTTPVAPSVRKLAAESGIDASTVPGSGKDGRVTKGDMLAAIERAAAAPTPVAQPAAAVQVRAPSPPDDAAREERVKMTRLRQTIARRLKEAQNTAAMLTTFNEVDMSAVMASAQPVQGAVREEARREARLHGLLREGLRAGAQGDSRRQRRDRRHRHHLQELLSHRRRGRHREGPGRAGGARLRSANRWPRSRRRSPTSAGARARARSRSRRCRAAPSRSPTAASTAR